MNVDIVTIHPKNHDYPMWRSMLERFSAYYNKAVVVFTGSGSPNYSDFVRGAVNSKKVLCVNSRNPAGDEDWRNVAVHHALGASSSEWIWFMEQDFFWKNDNFIKTLFKATDRYQAIGFWEANRLHPACLLIKRELLNKTRKDFSPDPGRLDHFGKFSEDIISQLGLSEIGELKNLGLVFESDWYHMQGLTHNINLCRTGDTGKIYKQYEFQTYLNYAPRIKVTQNKDFQEECRKFNNDLGSFEENNILKSFWEYML